MIAATNAIVASPTASVAPNEQAVAAAGFDRAIQAALADPIALVDASARSPAPQITVPQPPSIATADPMLAGAQTSLPRTLDRTTITSTSAIASVASVAPWAAIAPITSTGSAALPDGKGTAAFTRSEIAAAAPASEDEHSARDVPIPTEAAPEDPTDKSVDPTIAAPPGSPMPVGPDAAPSPAATDPGDALVRARPSAAPKVRIADESKIRHVRKGAAPTLAARPLGDDELNPSTSARPTPALPPEFAARETQVIATNDRPASEGAVADTTKLGGTSGRQVADAPLAPDSQGLIGPIGGPPDPPVAGNPHSGGSVASMPGPASPVVATIGPGGALLDARPVVAAAALPDVPVISGRPGQIGREMGIAIARQVTAGRNELTIRLDPIELGRIEVRMTFDDAGSLRTVMRAESLAALGMLRHESAALGQALSDAGVRSDSQSLQFDSRSSGNGDNGPSDRQPRRPTDIWSPGPAGDDHTTPPTYRPLRATGKLDLLA